jgi:hypothetical protein
MEFKAKPESLWLSKLAPESQLSSLIFFSDSWTPQLPKFLDSIKGEKFIATLSDYYFLKVILHNLLFQYSFHMSHTSDLYHRSWNVLINDNFLISVPSSIFEHSL